MNTEYPRSEPTPEIDNAYLQKALGTANERLAQQGTSEEVIDSLNPLYKAAARLKNYTWIVEADQVKCIAAEHMVMEEQVDLTSPRVIRGGIIMITTLAHMEATALKHKKELGDVQYHRIDRFRGKAFDGAKRYKMAEFFYRRGSRYFKSQESLNPNYIHLEFDAFTVHELFAQGKVEEALSEFENVTNEFDTSPEGIWLRDIPDGPTGQKGYAFKVWKSGLNIRTANDLMNLPGNNYQQLIDELLSSSEKMLVNEDGTTEGFSHRRTELADATKRYKSRFGSG